MADISAESASKTKVKAPRDVQVMLRLTVEGAGLLDELRGEKTRQEYLRDLVKADYLRRQQGKR
jgi:hypothetical protein